MIQRIQSLFLLVGAGLHILFFFIVFWTAQTNISESSESKIIKMSVYQVVEYSKDENAELNSEIQIFPLILNIVIIALALITIFLFKNRVLQNKLCRLLILLNTGLIVLLIFAHGKVKESILDSYVANFDYIGISLPILGLILFFITGRTIMKDEKKIRSVDRLR